MNTEAQRRATAAFVEKRKALGYRKITLWLSPEAMFKLDALKAAAGSKDKAADAAILAWAGHVPEKLGKPSAGRKTGSTGGSNPKVAAAIKSRVHVDVPVYERKEFNPQQKPGKAKR